MEWITKEVNEEMFLQDINQSEFPVFVDFWATWCPPCRMMNPLIEELAEEYKEKMLVRKLNTDLYRSIAEQYGISGIPTYIIFKAGQEITRMVGALSKKKLHEFCDSAIAG